MAAGRIHTVVSCSDYNMSGTTVNIVHIILQYCLAVKSTLVVDLGNAFLS